MKNNASRWLLFTTFLLVSACTKGDNPFDPEQHDKIDRKLNLSRSDYNNMGAPKKGDLVNKAEVLPPPPPPLPDLKQILAAPRPPELGQTQLVSISVTDDVPLKDVLLELARLANVDMELDSNISGGISFIAKNKPFNEVIARISELAGLRYSMENGVLRVVRDVPYIKNYSLDFLNADRSATSAINISTNVLSGAGGGSSGGSSGGSGSSGSGGGSSSSGGSGSGLNTGSQETITSTTVSDFWKSFDSGIYQILNFQAQQRTANGSVFALQPAADPTNSTVTVVPSINPATGAASGVVAPVTDNTLPAGGSTTSGTPSKLPNGAFYILNRQAGTLTVSATDRQHKMIEDFINRVRINAGAQVLIEGKIVEVTLDDQFQSGINWASINKQIGVFSNFNNIDPTSSNVFTVTLPNDRIIRNTGGDGGTKGDQFLQLLSRYGTTRTLSNPRLHAINNQQAVLTFAQNFVYFQVKVENDQATASGNTTIPARTTVSSEIRTVPIGIIMTLQPSINVETNDVTLNVRPTLSRITGTVTDPAIAFLNAGIDNQIPVVEVRELDSMLRLKSGQTMVIGGLMENSANNTDTGVPWLDEVPYVGNLFKGVDKRNQNKELIIFIKATIVGPEGNSSQADKNIYHKFTEDPRPLTF